MTTNHKLQHDYIADLLVDVQEATTGEIAIQLSVPIDSDMGFIVIERGIDMQEELMFYHRRGTGAESNTVYVYTENRTIAKYHAAGSKVILDAISSINYLLDNSYEQMYIYRKSENDLIIKGGELYVFGETIIVSDLDTETGTYNLSIGVDNYIYIKDGEYYITTTEDTTLYLVAKIGVDVSGSITTIDRKNILSLGGGTTPEDKIKLDGIQEGAEVNIGEEYTALEKTKLSEIEEGAVKDYNSLDNKPDLNNLHTHTNKVTLDKFGENGSGLPTYNGLDIDTTIAQRDVYDGLDSLDNTISLSAKQGKVVNDELQSHKGSNENPHSVTKTQVGLGNVPNIDTTDSVANEHTHSNKTVLDATTASFTTDDKTKLDDIQEGAEVNVGEIYTNTEKTKLGNITGNNTGDQDLSGLTIGASSSIDSDIVLFNGTSGKEIKDSGIKVVTALGSDDTTIPTSKAVGDAIGSSGGGDMLKSTYDTNNSGVVNNSEKVNGKTVEENVPAGALFTDTTYVVGDNGLTEKSFTSADKTKLDNLSSSAEANNISDIDATDLTDGGESILHYHDSDRDRANHNGTQPASTISDFDVEVSNNTDVVNNTTKNSYPSGDATKMSHISVTQAVDLDDIETKVNNLDSAVVLKGEWDASAGTFPGTGTAQSGFSYIISVAGIVDSVEFNVGDRVIAILDNASTTVYANNWIKSDYTDKVLSVSGKVGAVVLNKDDVGLSNVDNTADTVKPISTATQTALDNKVNKNSNITGSTKTKITYDEKGLVTGGTDATTADIADSTNKRYCTDSEKTTIGNQTGTNTGDQDLSGYAQLSGATFSGDIDASNVSENESNGTIVKRTTSGYIKSRYFNTSADDTTTVPSRIFVETGNDGYIRKQTTAQLITNLKLVKSDNSVGGVDSVLNMVSCTQAEYDALTPVATTFYIITDV